MLFGIGMSETEVNKHITPEMKQVAAKRAKYRAKAGRWDIDVAVFFFAILIIIVILLFEEVDIIIVSPVAVAGLALGWLMGWRKAKLLYEQFYEDELSKMERELGKTTGQTLEETIADKVQKALRDRWR